LISTSKGKAPFRSDFIKAREFPLTIPIRTKTMSSTDATQVSSAEEARTLMEARGFAIESVEEFTHTFSKESSTCYLIRIKDSTDIFIIRGDTGKVYESDYFWRNFPGRGHIHKAAHPHEQMEKEEIPRSVE
jgi:hypothetical protein